MRTSFSDSDPPDRHLKESGLMHTSCSHSHHQAYTRAASQQVAKTDPVNAPRPHSCSRLVHAERHQLRSAGVINNGPTSSAASSSCPSASPSRLQAKAGELCYCFGHTVRARVARPLCIGLSAVKTSAALRRPVSRLTRSGRGTLAAHRQLQRGGGISAFSVSALSGHGTREAAFRRC
jgi:hypothetical protein